jgi:hypothetical protein
MPASRGGKGASAAFWGVALIASIFYFLQPISLAALLAGWFALRMRPARSFAVVSVAILGLATMFLGSYMILPVLALGIGTAWLGRAIAMTKRPQTSATPEQRAMLEHEQRVVHLRQWEAAYADAHDGERPPAGFMPPIAPLAAASGGTNVMAILALVFGGGLLGIIFGHVAHSQIRRTGERGWGLATAGLVCGYIAVGGGIIAGIAYAVLVFS